MRINSPHFSAGVNANWSNRQAQGKTLERLSTGLRINRSSDDAAGLAISEKLRSQVRGSSQARKNALDGISMLNIGEGALNEVHSLLQRGRELSVQSATDSLTDSERTYIQQEVSNIIEEVDRISDATTFNGIQVLHGGVDSSKSDDLLAGLKDSWLATAEKLVLDEYGLEAEGSEGLDVKMESGGAGGVAAYVSYQYGADGKAINMSLTVDVDDFQPGKDTFDGTNGGTAPFYADRIIAHEMVHAVMASTLDTRKMSTWFKEGASELIHGADERVQGDLDRGYTAQQLVDFAADGGWASDSEHYSGAYLAAKYLDSKVAGGMKAFMGTLNTQSDLNDLDPFDTAIKAAGYADEADFLADFKLNGANFAGYGVTPGYAGDTGSIGGGDAENVIGNAFFDGADSAMSKFAENYDAAGDPFTLHIGAGDSSSDQLELSYGSINSTSINIKDLDVGTAAGAQGAITSFDEAIESVSSTRSDFGSYINRLEHSVNNLLTSETNQQSAESQIRDADFASEASEMTRQQILAASSMSMITQGTSMRQGILSLIN
jgi:flagellin